METYYELYLVRADEEFVYTYHTLEDAQEDLKYFTDSEYYDYTEIREIRIGEK